MHRLLRSGLGFFTVVLLGGAVGAEGGSQLPDYASPTGQEENFLWSKLAKVREYGDLIPEGLDVDDMVSTLTVPMEHVLDCPGASDRKVTIKMRAGLSRWDEEIVRKTVSNGDRAVGACIANYDFQWDRDAASIDFDFRLMFDMASIGGDEEEDPMGVWTNEMLVYHELLHCELLIKAIRNDAAWAAKACEGDVDLAPLDAQHLTIYPAVEQVLEKLADTHSAVTFWRIPSQRGLDGDGSFDLDLGEISDLVGKRTGVNAYFRLPANSNIEFDRSHDPPLPQFEFPRTGHIRFKGRLEDPDKSGFVLIRVVPAR